MAQFKSFEIEHLSTEPIFARYFTRKLVRAPFLVYMNFLEKPDKKFRKLKSFVKHRFASKPTFKKFSR